MGIVQEPDPPEPVVYADPLRTSATSGPLWNSLCTVLGRKLEKVREKFKQKSMELDKVFFGQQQ